MALLSCVSNKVIPQSLDGARVCARTSSRGSEQYGVIERPGPTKDRTITGFAVCKYQDQEHFYLFGCNCQWSILSDTCHDSLADALEFAQAQYGVPSTLWIDVV